VTTVTFNALTKDSNRHITKTNSLTFLQCPKAFWLFQFEPTSAAPPDLSAQRRLRMGQEVDRQARHHFPNGTHIPYRPNPTDQATRTAEAIADGATTLFQATFADNAVNGVLIKADILTRTPDGWHLIEVKSSTIVKPEHLLDVAFQQYVLAQAGLDVT
jgi:hypothetical protein